MTDDGESGPGTGERGSSGGGVTERLRAASARRRGRERGYRRALLLGLAVSVLLHLGLILLPGGIDVPLPPYAPGVGRPFPSAPLRVVRVRETPAVPAPIPRPAPPQRPREEEAEREERGAPEEVTRPEAEEAPLTNAERLRPRKGDPRLWRDFVLRPLFGVDDRADLTRAEGALYAAVAAYLDSVRLSEEQRRRLRDWTVGEGDERWGISPEGIHLGDITIPIPWGQLFAGQVRASGEERREIRERSEIQWQEALQEVEEVMEERREAMRERRRREEAEEEETEEADGEAEGSASDTTAARLPDRPLRDDGLLATGGGRALLARTDRP